MEQPHLKACIAAAEAGGEVLLRWFRHLDAASVGEKTKHDPVSAADKESEAVIQAELAARFPDYRFLGEESGASGQGEGPRWIVDPLDGTLNFVRGFPHWCVSVALWDDQGPLAGCVWDPLRQDLFAAARGQGASWNGRPMAVTARPGLDGAFLATGFAWQLGERWPAYNQALSRIHPRAQGIRRAGSAALDLAHTACGIYDGFFELGLKLWDLGAGVLLVREAGGEVSDWQGGGTWPETGNIVAGAPGVRRGVVAVVRD
ncbi:MAG: inositol monophosphatase family protein [Holophaga sp.]|jgi:myo-inositol-1(or 4)-monophosphatase